MDEFLLFDDLRQEAVRVAPLFIDLLSPHRRINIRNQGGAKHGCTNKYPQLRQSQGIIRKENLTDRTRLVDRYIGQRNTYQVNQGYHKTDDQYNAQKTYGTAGENGRPTTSQYQNKCSDQFGNKLLIFSHH